MKLTEKELNEFPIGIKIRTESGNTFIKTGYNTYAKDSSTECFWEDDEVIAMRVNKIDIPTYTEYIPKKQILDKKEKEYLSYVIRPWRKIVKYIKKKGSSSREYIFIGAEESDDVALPYFKAGTMYKCMELDREYSLEELGL